MSGGRRPLMERRRGGLRIPVAAAVLLLAGLIVCVVFVWPELGSRYTGQLCEMHPQYVELQQNHQRTQNATRDVSKKLAAVTTERDQLEREKGDLVKERDDLNVKLSELTAACANDRGERDSLKADLERLRTVHEALNRTVGSLAEAHKQVAGSGAQCRAELATAQKQLNTMQLDLKSTEVDLKEAQAQLEEGADSCEVRDLDAPPCEMPISGSHNLSARSDKFLSVVYLSESLPTMRRQLAEAMELARALNRTLVLPSVSNGSVTVTDRNALPLCSYFSVGDLQGFNDWVPMSAVPQQGLLGFFAKPKGFIVTVMPEGNMTCGDEALGDNSLSFMRQVAKIGETSLLCLDDSWPPKDWNLPPEEQITARWKKAVKVLDMQDAGEAAIVFYLNNRAASYFSPEQMAAPKALQYAPHLKAQAAKLERKLGAQYIAVQWYIGECWAGPEGTSCDTAVLEQCVKGLEETVQKIRSDSPRIKSVYLITGPAVPGPDQGTPAPVLVPAGSNTTNATQSTDETEAALAGGQRTELFEWAQTRLLNSSLHPVTLASLDSSVMDAGVEFILNDLILEKAEYLLWAPSKCSTKRGSDWAALPEVKELAGRRQDAGKAQAMVTLWSAE